MADESTRERDIDPSDDVDVDDGVAAEDAVAADEAADAEAEAVARRRAAKRERSTREDGAHEDGTKADSTKSANTKAASTKAAGAKAGRTRSGAKDDAARARQERRSRTQQEKHLRRSGNPAKRGSSIRKPLGPPTIGDWIGAMRIRTLPMSIAPVAVGAAAAYNLEGFHLAIALLCLGVALCMQLGVNVANDYSDGVRGTDRERVGPKRITTSTSVEPRTVRTVALVLLGLGAACGVALTIVSGQWWLLAVGAACLLAAWFYTGGRFPYGYYALGELVVFIIFGPVAVLGTMYATLGTWSEDGLILSVAMGCFAAATMLVNNLRDIDSDRASGKHTVPTIIGRVASKVLYAILIIVPFGILWVYTMAFAYGPAVMLTLLVALPAVVVVAMGRTPRDFITALGLTSLTALLYGIGVALTFWAGVTGFAL